MTLKTQKTSKIKELFEFDEKAAGAANTKGMNVSSTKPVTPDGREPSEEKEFSSPRITNRHSVCHVIGTDEAGRGPGAGPVFAAAVCFKTCDEKLFEALSLLNDSKQISEKNRESLYETIINLPESVCAYHIEAGSVEQIEKINILNTSLSCMHLACESVAAKHGAMPFTVLVDGNKKIKQANGKAWVASQTTVVKGDSKSAAIAAASILAKVSRDRFMCDLAKEFPHYGWERNKGYLTAEHVEAIKKHGVTSWHRAKFLRKILGEGEAVAPCKKSAKNQLSLF